MTIRVVQPQGGQRPARRNHQRQGRNERHQPRHNRIPATPPAEPLQPARRESGLLGKFGRAGVPFYVVFPARSLSSPIPLSEIITPASVVEALDRAGPSRIERN